MSSASPKYLIPIFSMYRSIDDAEFEQLYYTFVEMGLSIGEYSKVYRVVKAAFEVGESNVPGFKEAIARLRA